MTNPRITRWGLVLILATCTLFVSLGVVMAQENLAATIREVTENQPTQEQAQELAQTGYDLAGWTVDGGGTTSNTGSGYSLGFTIGQPDAAVWSGSNYTLAGGFWRGGTVEYRHYLPLVLKG